ncbi:hypothetical protein WMY93_005191 [Mugilogobius chulae]|uniref:Uncharacterized protein n=1 Tax=Mugilogobius chulae TaxID=88201 RepID=A0AAW0Q5J3_9GOBI
MTGRCHSHHSVLSRSCTDGDQIDPQEESFRERDVTNSEICDEKCIKEANVNTTCVAQSCSWPNARQPSIIITHHPQINNLIKHKNDLQSLKYQEDKPTD